GDDFSDNVGREHERNLLRRWGMECSGTIRRLSSAVKVPLDAITDRLRESEDVAVIERLKAVIAEVEPPAQTANKPAKPPKRRKAKVAAAGQRAEGRGGVQVVKARDDVQNPALTLRLPVPLPTGTVFLCPPRRPCGAHPCGLLPDLPMPCPSPLSGQVSIKEAPISSAQLARHRPQTRNQNDSGQP